MRFDQLIISIRNQVNNDISETQFTVKIKEEISKISNPTNI